MWVVVLGTWWGTQEVAGPFATRAEADDWRQANKHKFTRRIYIKHMEES